MATDLFIDDVVAVDPIYGIIRDGTAPQEIAAKNLCLELWSAFEIHADAHFIEQFQIDFDARFWEMYLTCTLIENGFELNCPKPGPDILISSCKNNVWIEAVAPTSGATESPDKVSEVEFNVEVRDIPDEKMILRYTTAISEKMGKYKGYINQGIIRSDDPFIIAINGCRVYPFSADFEPPRIVRAVFPIGHEYITVDRETGEKIDSGFKFKPCVKKASGTDIPIDIFLNPEFSRLSGILFSRVDCCNRPTKYGADFIFVHNPLAENPVGEGIFKLGTEWIAEPVEHGYYRLRFNDWNKK